VSPIFFPGGDIGSLSVHGTVNDLSMRGARPLFIAASFILEEGLRFDELESIVSSMRIACEQSKVQLIAADTKVVNKGAADRIFITTTGIGLVTRKSVPAANRARPRDCVIVSGDIGRHGVAIMSCREGIEFETEIQSDSAPLIDIVDEIMNDGSDVHCLRDITRGGLASVLNELAALSEVGIVLEEEHIPIHPQVKAVCEILGLDPLYVACEGRFVAIVPENLSESVLRKMKTFPHADSCRLIGRITQDHGGRVLLRSRLGGHRSLDKLAGEQLPRIC
jgi:hydrogenase expression/formation protein HypE